MTESLTPRIDLYKIDLRQNKILSRVLIGNLEISEFLVGHQYVSSWHEYDHLIWIGVEDGEVVWSVGKNKQWIHAFKWMFWRMCRRLTNVPREAWD